MYVVLLAMVAGFLAMRLYSVLGKRTGHEQQPLARAAEDRAPTLPIPRTVDAGGEPRDMAGRNVESGAEQGLRAIISGEPGFDVPLFVEGAKSAYGMILDAFWRGDEETLATLCEDDVRAAFVEAIEQRRAAGHVLENRLVAVERAAIVGASLQGREARIVIRFDADISAITRDADGVMIAGSTTDAVETHDIWTFARTLRSSDPNWKLADTDEA